MTLFLTKLSKDKGLQAALMAAAETAATKVELWRKMGSSGSSGGSGRSAVVGEAETLGKTVSSVFSGW